jgi:hypothetical protein
VIPSRGDGSDGSGHRKVGRWTGGWTRGGREDAPLLETSQRIQRDKAGKFRETRPANLGLHRLFSAGPRLPRLRGNYTPALP